MQVSRDGLGEMKHKFWRTKVRNEHVPLRRANASLTRLGDLLHFGQLFIACGNN